MSSRRLAASIAFAVVLVDQATKIWAAAVLDDGPISLIGDVLRLRLTRNSGAAFSILQGLGPLIAVAAVGVIGLILVMLSQVPRRLEVVGLAMILGGAIGNLIDRIFRGSGVLDGSVVDWIDPSFFPAFNGADSALSIGVGLLVIGALRPATDE